MKHVEELFLDGENVTQKCKVNDFGRFMLDQSPHKL